MIENVTKLIDLKTKLKAGGGKAAIEKQHSLGKKTARERLSLLFDEGTFIETGLFINYGETSEGVITGYGQVNGRLVYAYSEDFTVMNGAFGKDYAEKILKCQEDALKVGAPIIYINDTCGAKINEGVDILSCYAKVLANFSKLRGVIPQISVLLGDCNGTYSFSAGISDFVFMIDEKSKLFVNSQNLSEKNLKNFGDSKMHSEKTGIAHFNYISEEECFSNLRLLLSYLPQNCEELPEIIDGKDDLNRICTELNNLITNDDTAIFDIKKVINSIADENKFFEIQKDFACNIVVGFIRLGGYVVGVVANNSNCKNGKLDINALEKATGFISTCNMYNIPILTMVDTDGFVNDSEQEECGLVKFASELVYTYTNIEVPKVTLIVRKNYGSAYSVMCPKEMGADVVYAWSDAKIANMDVDAAMQLLYFEYIKKSKDPVSEKQKKIKEYEENFMNPYVAAKKGLVDDVIEPADSRKMLIAAFDMLYTKM